jgi:polyisoprenoid-binding protein YceI
MKRNAFVLATLLASTFALSALAADSWTVDKAHSEATFRIRHLVSTVSGKFDDISGTVTGDIATPGAASVEFSMKTASIDTGVPDRDKHLRSADFFDAEKFPEITFRSTSIKPSGRKNVFNVTGNLTMRGVTKQITLPVDYLGAVKDPWGNEKAGFATSITLNRKDYGVNWNKALDNGGVLLGDDVDVRISLEMGKSKAAAKEEVKKEKSN